MKKERVKHLVSTEKTAIKIRGRNNSNYRLLQSERCAPNSGRQTLSNNINDTSLDGHRELIHIHESWGQSRSAGEGRITIFRSNSNCTAQKTPAPGKKICFSHKRIMRISSQQAGSRTGEWRERQINKQMIEKEQFVTSLGRLERRGPSTLKWLTEEKGDIWLKNHPVTAIERDTHSFRVVDEGVGFIVAEAYIDQILHSVLPLFLTRITLEEKQNNPQGFVRPLRVSDYKMFCAMQLL